ncbi:MAG: hypothetical protein AABZ12_04625 [Planctomycetota bacterium]
MCSLALIPTVPASASILASVVEPYGGVTGSWDLIRWWQLFVATLSVFAAIVIWRQTILWTLGRKWLTALISMIPYVQVIHAQTWWTLQTRGCMDFRAEEMRLGEHLVGVGVWIWVTVWVWWGWEKCRMRPETSIVRRPVVPMPPIARRILLSFGTLPISVGALFFIGICLDDVLGPADRAAITFTAYSTTASIFVAAWLLIWRKSVAWSPQVVRRTIMLTALLLVLPIAAPWVLVSISGSLDEVLSVLPVIGWGAWMVCTIFSWPMRLDHAPGQTPDPHCLGCGYSLSGLSATRCPECGTEPTLDELWAGTCRSVGWL